MENKVTTLQNVRSWAMEQFDMVDQHPLWPEHYRDGRMDAMIELLTFLGFRCIDGQWILVVPDEDADGPQND